VLGVNGWVQEKCFSAAIYSPPVHIIHYENNHVAHGASGDGHRDADHSWRSKRGTSANITELNNQI